MSAPPRVYAYLERIMYIYTKLVFIVIVNALFIKADKHSRMQNNLKIILLKIIIFKIIIMKTILLIRISCISGPTDLTNEVSHHLWIQQLPTIVYNMSPIHLGSDKITKLYFRMRNYQNAYHLINMWSSIIL